MKKLINYVKKKVKEKKGINLDLEISHHYGIENFYNYGTSMITFVNEDYCKKVIFQFKDQINQRDQLFSQCLVVVKLMWI